MEQFLRTATDVASARPLSERERDLVAEARRLRRQLYVRLGPKPLPAAKKVPHCGRPAPAGGIRSVVSGGLPGMSTAIVSSPLAAIYGAFCGHGFSPRT
ncbi:hypothetical protein R4P70_31570, partial [Rhodococcus sp. IEGM 1241]|nr:hypothetical protein [Rhodococcus sp. IEGM 1241]